MNARSNSNIDPWISVKEELKNLLKTECIHIEYPKNVHYHCVYRIRRDKVLQNNRFHHTDVTERFLWVRLMVLTGPFSGWNKIFSIIYFLSFSLQLLGIPADSSLSAFPIRKSVRQGGGNWPAKAYYIASLIWFVKQHITAAPFERLMTRRVLLKNDRSSSPTSPALVSQRALDPLFGPGLFLFRLLAYPSIQRPVAARRS